VYKIKTLIIFLSFILCLLSGCSGNSGPENHAAIGDDNPIDTENRVDTTPEDEHNMNSNCASVTPGWTQSYAAGYIDSNGLRAGGSEILHIVSHGGKLYAAAGYWMDGNNIWYGGSDYRTGWGQILRLDEPGGQWQVDLDMGPTHLRPEILKEVTFTTDGTGAVLSEPVSLLVASTYTPLFTNVTVNFFTRNDLIGGWEETSIMSGPPPGGEYYSVRGAHVHKDSVTGVDRIFVSIGTQGIFSGVYDPDAPGDIAWDSQPEVGPLEIRPLAVVEANGSLLFSSGKYIYQRNDGGSPTYTIVHDMSDLNTNVVSAVGGIRGLTAIPNPNGVGDSLIFVWSPDGKSQGHIVRLDPDGSGTFVRHEEAIIGELINDYLPGSDPVYVLSAYNDFIPVTDPATGEVKHLVGFEAMIRGDHPRWETFYKGAMYAIRHQSQQYTLTEVNGLSDAEKPPLVAPRAYALSPFDYCDYEQIIYFGGHDANSYRSDDRAWIFSAPLTDALNQ